MTARTGRGTSRLVVDLIACDGRGLCAEALPEVIALDDWGFPIVSDRPVPSRLLPDARATVCACPMLALRLSHAPPAWSRRGRGAPASCRLHPRE